MPTYKIQCIFLSGVRKWTGREIFQIFLSKKCENQQHETPQEISQREKNLVSVSQKVISKPLLKSHAKRI